MNTVEAPEARGIVERTVFRGFLEEKIAAAAIFVACYKAENGGYDRKDYIVNDL